MAAAVFTEVFKYIVRRADANECRKDALYDDICGTIDTLKEYSLEFWSQDAKDLGENLGVLRANIIGMQQYLNDCISDFCSGEVKHECDIASSRFIDAMTGGDFFDPDREMSEETLAAIHRKSLRLKRQVRISREQMKRKFFA